MSGYRRNDMFAPRQSSMHLNSGPGELKSTIVSTTQSHNIQKLITFLYQMSDSIQGTDYIANDYIIFFSLI